MIKTFYAGMETDAPCGRCKMETTHRVLSMTDGVPEKLICVSCNSVHKFRQEKIKTEAAPNRATRPATKAVQQTSRQSVSPAHFQHLMVSEQAGAIAKPYGQGVPWEVGMWVDHPSFGLGKVKSKSGRKIDVLFQSGLKTLIAM